jgi:hypothetical protein
LSQSILTEIEPGSQVSTTGPRPKLPKFAIFNMMRLGNGDYRPSLVSWDEWVALRPSLLGKLGITADRQTLIRLGLNGYIQVRQTTPATWEMHLGSWLAHLKAVQEDAHFWGRVGESGKSRRETYDASVYGVGKSNQGGRQDD